MILYERRKGGFDRCSDSSRKAELDNFGSGDENEKKHGIFGSCFGENEVKIKTCIAGLCFLFLWTCVRIPARAGFYVGLQAGRSRQDVKAGKVSFVKDSSFLYGGQIGFRFLSLAVEGEYFRAGHDLISQDLSFPASSQEMDYSYLGVKGKWGIPLAVVYPYLLLGYGTCSVSLAEVGDDSTSSFSLGAGAEITLGKIGLFAELRYADFDLDIEAWDWDFGGLNIHLGLNFHF